MALARTIRSRTFVLTALLLLVLGASSSDLRAQYEYEWGKALLDLRLDDMAEKVFTDLSKSAATAEKSQGLTGLALLKRNAAQRTDDVELRSTLNGEAVTTLDKVVKQLSKSSDGYWDTVFSLAGMLQEVVQEDIDFIKRGSLSEAQRDALIETDLKRLDRAEQLYEQAKSNFEDAEDESPEAGNLVKATLDQFILRLRKAQLKGTNPKKLRSPERLANLGNLRDDLGNFAAVNDGTANGVLGYYWLAQALEELHVSDGSVPADEVSSYYEYVIDTLIYTPAQAQKADVEWRPTTAGRRVLAEASYLKLLEFMNRKGWGGKVIKSGEKLRGDFAACNYTFGVRGELAMLELGQAYLNDGRSGEALEIAASISKEGGFAGQQADKLMSTIINAAPTKENFDPKLLLAGANGARLAARRDEKKWAEAVSLYRGVIENLAKIEDPVERNDIGREAGFRIGQALDKMGRKLEAASTFEMAYRRFNNDKIRQNPKRNDDIQSYWLAMLRDFQRETNGSEFAKGLYNDATSYVITNPAKGDTKGPTELVWRKAEGLRRQKSFRDALKYYEQLAATPSEYQERAIVKKAVVSVSLLDRKASADKWVEAAKQFEDYKAYAAKTPISDPALRDARKSSLIEADLQIAGAYSRAAKAAKTADEQKAYYTKILDLSDGFGERTTDENAAQYVRFLRFTALEKTGRADEAEAVYNEMARIDPDHKNVPSAALRIYKLLKAKADLMPTVGERSRAKRDAVALRAADAYRLWLLKKDPKKVGNWTLGYKAYYDAERWDDAYAILRKAIEKFDGKRGTKKSVDIMRRRLAHVLLEKAKKAYNDEEVTEAEDLFKEAATLYKGLVGDPPKGPRSLLAEAAEVFGGFVTGPNSRGRYGHFEGTAEFEKSLEIWTKLFNWTKKGAATPEKALANRKLNAKADFYKFFMYFKLAQARKDQKALGRLKRNIKAKRDKTPDGRIGGPEWYQKWNWLDRQL